MPIQQVSVFLDNKPGSLSEVLEHLDKAQSKIYALSIADAGEFGLIRLITKFPQKATKILENADFNLAKSKKNIEVTVAMITEKNKIARIAKILGDNALNIEYAYSSAIHVDGKFALVLRVNELEKAEKILKENSISILTLEDLEEHFEES